MSTKTMLVIWMIIW